MTEVSSNTERGELRSRKFVRIGDKLFYSEKMVVTHQDIARENGVTEEVTEEGRTKPIVDDAGMMAFAAKTGKLVFHETTSGTHIKGDPDEARKETIKVAKSLFGENSVSDTVNFSVRPPEA